MYLEHRATGIVKILPAQAGARSVQGEAQEFLLKNVQGKTTTTNYC